MEEIAKTAKEAIAEILKDKDWKLIVINHLNYSAATVITEDVNRNGCYKSETHNPKTHPWVRRIQDTIKDIRKDLSA